MLLSIKEIEAYAVQAADGILGAPQDFLFDDDAWVIRYLVVKTESAPQRRVLISPISVKSIVGPEKVLSLTLTRQMIKDSPDIDTHKPVSRQQEVGYLGYYGYGLYWGGGGLWGAALYPDTLQAGLTSPPALQALHDGSNDRRLRSANAVMRYYVHATDGDIGHVHGILVNEETWAVQYVIVNTSNWWLGHQVLVAPEWIDHVSWAESTVYLELSRDAVKNSPPYDPTMPIEREQEVIIHAHYGRKPYWPVDKDPSEAQRTRE